MKTKNQTHLSKPTSKPTKEDILRLVGEYIQEKDAENKFVAGETYVPSSGATWNYKDIVKVVDTLLNRWYGGVSTYEFERLLAATTKQRLVSICNSGSSANLLAISALMSKEVGKRGLKVGDEVITPACGFPTTLNPIIQNGLVPVFVDVSIPSYNAIPHEVEEAISPKTKAVFMAHALGNPYKAKEIRDLCDRNDLWHISDCCDALGSEYDNVPTPYWADMSTYSFYPAHQLSTVEGGAISTDNPRLNKIIRSFRDWGKDCHCLPGQDDACGKRYCWKLGDLPEGYDHKYIFSEIGYNLKSSDLHAALGINQVMRIGSFLQARQDNWQFYREAFEELREFFVLPEPTPKSKPSWFGFMLTVRDKSPFTRNEIVRYLEENKIGTRMMFGGNLTKQPAYKNARYRVSGVLTKSDRIMNNGFWLGVYQGITPPMREYVLQKIIDFIKAKKKEKLASK